MDELYAGVYGDLGRTHWWWQARDAIVLRELARHRTRTGQQRILDVGCGDGRLFEGLGQFGSVVGIEPDPIARGKGSPFGPIHLAPFAVPLPVEPPFDLVVMLDVLEHLVDPVAALQLARNLLAPDGLVVLTVPALRWLWTNHDNINHHFLRYDRVTLIRQIEEAGLHPVNARFMFHSLVAPKLAVRGLERLLGPTDKPPTVPARPLNSVLATVLELEERLARPLARWLPGSSLIATCRVS